VSSKACSVCKQVKPVSEYYKDLTKAMGVSSSCKECINTKQAVFRSKNRELLRERARQYRENNPERASRLGKKRSYDYVLKKKYSMTRQQYEQMMTSQDGKCLICREKAKLVVDHDHATREVRGLLCRKCNTALGLLRDSPLLANQAMVYLLEKNARGISKEVYLSMFNALEEQHSCFR